MGTRSNIAMEQEDGCVKVAYCHYDGYLESVGVKLLTEYDTREKVDELIDMGNMRSLGEKNHPEEPETYVSLDNYMSWHVDPVFIEYIYLWRDGEWLVSRSKSYDAFEGYRQSQYYHTYFKPLHEEFWLKKSNTTTWGVLYPKAR